MSTTPRFQDATTEPNTTTEANATDESVVGGETASFGQQRIWLISQLEGAGAAYNEPLAYRLRGSLDRDVLRRAFDALAQRHDTLRTRLVAAEDGLRAVIDPPERGYAVEIDDLSELPDPTARVAALRQQEAAQPFDLGRGPLARARLIVLGPTDHILLVTVHHTIFDGRSMELLLSELSSLYANVLRDDGTALPPLPARYADFARRQRDWSLGGEAAEQEAFWAKTLADAPPLLELPTDRPRPARQDHDGGRVPVHLEPELVAALGAVARQHRSTLFGAVLTGWTALLSRLTGQTDIVVGSPVANRRRPEYTGLIGFFVQTLALRVDLSGDPTGSDLLRRTRAVLRAALDHQDVPFERVVDLVNPPRSAAHTPLFQTMLAWAPARADLVSIPGTEAEALDIPHAAAKFDLALSLEQDDSGVHGYLDYATALFDRDTVERYAAYLKRLLAQIARDPGAEVADHALTDEAAEQRILAQFSGLGADNAHPVTAEEVDPAGIVERFEAQVRAHPHAPAVVAGKDQLDYATLQRRAARLAHALIARGVRPGACVALHCGRTVDLTVGVLGILSAGAAYLPLDPAQPPDRIAAMVTDAKPALVLTDAPGSGEGWEEIAAVEAEGERDDPPGIRTGDADLAYVIHTSGSTGRPKGVAVTYGSIRNLFAAWRKHFPDTPGEPTSAWSGIGFDASIHELLLPLTTGAVVHLVPDEVRGDPAALFDWMREHRIVQAFLPPSYVKWIDEDPETRLAGLALRQLLTGVESLPERALLRMTRALPGLRICFGYGPTEATLYSTAYYDPQPLDRPAPIGRPLPGTRLYLLDERRRPVPVGVPGEVFLAGASLAQGYLNRPDLTAERFLPDPFVPGGRMYRTGDLARWLPDGNASYLGRRDDQIKLRGFRIEPREIEAALLALPDVGEAVVLADRDDAGESRLVAVVAGGEVESRTPSEWRSALSRRLPDYMIPAQFVRRTALPLTPSGKLDRALLLAEARTARGDEGNQVNTASPRDHVEMALYRMWRRILLHPSIGVTDNFFDLGGTSLSAIKVASAVREEFGRELPIREILLHPTIEALAELLRAGTVPRGADSDVIEFRRGNGHRRVVCVHPAGGTAFCYLSLATALPEEVGVVGLQSPGLSPGESPLPDVGAMAQRYLELVDPLPGESLVVCGLSYGGLVAYEMGRRLAAAGHRNFSVVLLDTIATDDTEVRAALGPVDAAEFREKLVRFNGMYPGIDDDQIDRYFRIYNHNRMTARAYTVPTSPARVVFVEAAPEPGAEATPDAVADTEEAPGAEARAVSEARDFWRRKVRGGFAVETVGGGHWDLLESDEVPRIAEIITAELDRTAVPGTLPGAAAPAEPSAMLER